MRIQVVSNALRPALALIPGFLIAWASYVAFQDLMYRGLDGSYYFLLARELGSFGSFWPGLTLDHLQGCSSLQFPVNFNLSLTFRLADLLPFSQKADIFTASLLLLATGTLLLARILRFDGLALGIFFLLNLVALLPVPAGFYGLAGCAPVFPELSMLAALATVLMLSPKGNNCCVKISFIYLILFYVGLCYPTFLVLFLPQLLLWGAIASRNFLSLLKISRYTRLTKNDKKNISLEITVHFLLGIILLVISLWIYGHIKNSTFNFFKSQIVEHTTLSDVSLFFWEPRSLGAVILQIGGLASAAFFLFHRKHEEPIWIRLAAFLLLFTMAQSLIIFLIQLGFVSTRGVALIYIEYLQYPLSFAIVIAALRKNQINHSINNIHFLPNIFRRVFLIIVVAGLAFSFYRLLLKRDIRCGVDFFNEPKRNEIIQNLISSLNTNDNKTFQFLGRCESFLGLGKPFKDGYDWLEFHAFQGVCTEVLKNDLRTTGLWNFGIPTLFHYSPLRDPFLHQFTKQFLARPPDSVWKNVPVYTKISPNALGLLGVRFVITDSKITEENVELKAFIPWPNEKDKLKNLWWPHPARENPWIGIRGIYLYELKKVNLGTQSPILVLSDQNDADTVLKTLASKNYFKGEKPIAVHSEQNLVAPAEATDVKLLYSPHGFTVSAKSNGRSGLLLPFTFSNCLKYTPATNMSKNESVKLYRANLAQTLLIFDKEINGEIKYISTPFYNPQDIWKDVLDGKHAFNK